MDDTTKPRSQRKRQATALQAAPPVCTCHLPPGPSDAAHEATVRVLAQGMLGLGLLNKNKVGSVDGPRKGAQASCPELGVPPPVPSPWRRGLA